MTGTTQIVRTFDAEFLPRVLEQIEKARKLATRLGAPQPVAILSPEYMVKTGRRSRLTGEPIMKPVHDIDLTVEPLRYNGWTLRARIEHDREIGTLVHCVPGQSVPESYRTAAPTCDHCKAKRARKDTFVLQHDDGQFFCVGRQCVADFLGHNVNLMTAWRVIGAADDEEFWGGLRSDPAYSLDHELIPYAAAIIREHGFISRKAAQIAEERHEPCGSTTSTLLMVACSPSGGSDSYVSLGSRSVRELAFAQETYAAADALLKAEPTIIADVHKYWSDIRPRSEFDDNCQKILRVERITTKHFGLFCAAVSGYFRHLGTLAQRKVERAAGAESRHIGQIGKREAFAALTCTGVIDVPTDFGTLHINKLQDAAGNIIVWKTGSDRLKQGHIYTGKCTVKKHDAYQGIAQTIVNRCALVDGNQPGTGG